MGAAEIIGGAAVIALCLGLLLGCAPLNAARPYERSHGYRPERITPQPGERGATYVALAFSGGGTRAAAFSYGVLEALRATKIASGEKTVAGTEAIDLISSVSGGSFTAAYFGLFRERIFTEFRERMLSLKVERGLLLRVLLPWNWGRLLSFRFSRIDLAAEMYESIFESATFERMPLERPFIVINATDMSIGARFPFTQPQLDLLGSDLSSYPVARAVAASSAFPGGFSPLTLQNHGAAGYPWGPVERGLGELERNLDYYRLSASRLSYRDASARPWCHLLDGGLSDNTGARELIAALRNRTGAVLGAVDDARLEHLLFVVVNAKGRADVALDRSRSTPGLVPVIVSTGSVAMDNYTDESVMAIEWALQSLREAHLARWREAAPGEAVAWEERDRKAAESRAAGVVTFPVLDAAGKHERDVTGYVVHVCFDAVPGKERRDELLAVKTALTLPPDVVEKVIDAGHDVLVRSAAFQAFVAGAKGEAPRPRVPDEPAR